MKIGEKRIFNGLKVCCTSEYWPQQYDVFCENYKCGYIREKRGRYRVEVLGVNSSVLLAAEMPNYDNPEFVLPDEWGWKASNPPIWFKHCLDILRLELMFREILPDNRD